MTQVEFRCVSKIFQTGSKKVTALANVDFCVKKGEFWTIIGPSGSGKTTLLRCLAGFESLTQGEIFVAGKKITAPGRDRMMVFQDLAQLFPWQSVIGNVLLALKLAGRGQNASERQELARYYLDLVGLAEYAHFYPHQLSGGMKQRVAITRALGVKPEVLLMDEPFGSLDAITRTGLQNELLRIWQETGVTIVFVTHNIEEALLLADNIMVLSRGGVVQAVVKNPLPRPRSLDDIDFAPIWQHLHNLLEEAGPSKEQGSSLMRNLEPRTGPAPRPAASGALHVN
ncbi:MAG: ABC transporter ATP-binding protein [bacterium]|jgi:NitT/TauT family transport system ATP-binding protein